MLEMLDEAAGQRNESEPEEHQHQFPAINEAQEAQLPFEGSKDTIPCNAMSDFLYNMPGKLFWSHHSPSRTVFWSSDCDDDWEGTQTLSSPKTEEIQGKIKNALQRFYDAYNLTFMFVQFWAPVEDGIQTLLSTSSFPFSLTIPIGDVCWYRKHCMHYKYKITDGSDENEDQLGPLGRAFRSGALEYTKFVGDYSIKEYPLRNTALRYGARELRAVPVFESHGRGQRCVGVFEILFLRPASACQVMSLIGLSMAIEKVGLRAPNFPPFLLGEYLWKNQGCHLAAEEINKGLKKVCEAHNVPLAQIWKARCDEIGPIKALSLNKIRSYKQSEKYSSFVETCERSNLREGEGVTGKAFSSLTSCFCKDVSRLSTTEYSLAVVAFMADLTGCFAICLRSSHTGYTSYVVEFFLPTSETANKEPRAFLDTLLTSIKRHFPSFRIAYGLQLGEELYVEVIGLPGDNELDPFRICQTTYSPPRPSCPANEGENAYLHSSCKQLAPGVDYITYDGSTRGPEQSNVALPLDEQFPPYEGETMQIDPPSQSLSSRVNAARGGEQNVSGPKQNNDVVNPLEREVMAKTPSWWSEITLEDLGQHFGKKLQDAAKSLNVSRSTFKRICRKHKISRWPSCRREVQQALSVTNAKKQIAEDSSRNRPHVSVSTPDEGNVSNAHPIPQSTTMLNESSMTIKARYRADMIKFELSISSAMTDLVNEVTKRFKLQADMFKAKYQDEDNDLILLACDEDLRKCLSTMRSLARTVINIVIESTNDAS